MNLFGKKNKNTTIDWDRANLQPVLRCSICNGEQVFGFRDKRTGDFSELALIRTKAELYEFAGRYGIKPEDISKVY
ncbi:MAG: aspartate dehydrogenase [Lachnospiraceae bacterium]|nr:aspartate dehydrogenase [Lachnospiraceae bacterium]